MADLFDIANLITTVGVEAVKIKQEPGLPEKSSNEILTELFSTFDADEGIASPVDDKDAECDNDDDDDKSTHGKKKKKSKKKHKHKDKKHKKRSKHNSSESDSDEDSGAKKKKKHKKKSKRKHSSHSSEESDPNVPSTKKRKTESLPPLLQCKIEPEDSQKLSVTGVAPENTGKDFGAKITVTADPGSPELPSVLKKVRDEEDDDAAGARIPRLLEKGKQQTQTKILIKDLKNSTVYNETVKEIETREKEKAAKMEDGEISDSSSYNRTPTLSPTPPLRRDSPMNSPVRSPSYRKRNRASSPGGVGVLKTDLRLVLKEKEKKKLGTSRKSESREARDSRSKNSRDHRISNKESRHKNNDRRSESRERKVNDFSSHRRSRSGGRESRRRSSERRDRSDEKRGGRSHDRRKYNKDDLDDYGNRNDDKYWDKHGRTRSRSKERKERIEIDKKKLLEIARRNAINMIKQGALPLAQQDKAIAAIQAGGKSVDELTDFCKSLSKSEALGELSSISSDDDGNSSEKGFHHPFILRERPTSIIMNIKDAKQLPNKTFQEKTAESSTQLTLKFPVSSGQHHRKTESEWIPVVPKKPEPKKTFVPAVSKPVPQPFAILPPLLAPPAPAPVPVPAPLPVPAPITIQTVMPTVQPQVQPQVFPPPPQAEPVDIGSIVSQRLAAMRRLRENPQDVEALSSMYHAQNGMKNWAESKQMPGQFTGSTGVKVLSPAELHSGYHAWARKDQLVTAAPVSSGMGMALLQKMGWRPGEGLGKNKEGTLVPLQLEVKLDKRGLVSDQDLGQKIGKIHQKPVVPMIKTLEGKHPVSLLGEYCSKRKFGAPVYELCFECGPDHKKNFLFKVKVNGIEYKPTVASPNKKQAKAEAAQICLQTLGLLPT